MITREDITKIWSASYAKAALDPEADMRFVADLFENIRSQLNISDPFGYWDYLVLDSDKFDNVNGLRLLTDLRDNYFNHLYTNLIQELQNLYEINKNQALKQWRSVYSDAAVHYRYDLLCMLFLLRTNWGTGDLPVAGSEKLPAYIRENRWPDAVPFYVDIAADEDMSSEIRALAEITLLEIVLYYYPETSSAIKHLDKATSLLPGHFQTIRAEGIYLMNTGEIQKSRNNLLKVIGIKPGDYFSFNIIGDGFSTEGMLENAQSWYMDALRTNFLQGDSYQRLLILYGNKSWFNEKKSLMDGLLQNIIMRSDIRNTAVLIEKGMARPDYFVNLLTYDGYRETGTAWLKAGDYSQAESWYLKAAELQPDYVPAWLDMANLEKERGSMDKDLGYLEKALQIDPDHYDVHWLMALYFSDAKMENEALEHFNKCLQLRPIWSDWIYNFIGNLYFSLQQYEKSEEYYAHAISLNDSFPILRENLAGAMDARADQLAASSQFDEAEKLYLKAASVDKSANRWNIAGNFYYQKKDWIKAVESYNMAIEIDPGDPVIHENKGLALEKLKQNDQAEQSFLTALGLEKVSGRYFNRLGVFYYNLTVYDKAVYYYQQAIDHDPDQLIYLENICLAFESMNRLELAEPYYERMISIAPDNDRILNLAGIYYFNRNNLEKAEDLYKKAIEKNKTNVTYYQNLSAVYRATGKFREGIVLLEKALEHDPKNDISVNNIGVFYSDLNEHEKALQYYEKALSINSGSALYYENIGYEKSIRNEIDEALFYYNKAMELNPANDLTVNNLGFIYYNQGNYTEAAQYFKKAMEIKPDNALYMINLGNALNASDQKQEALKIYQKAVTLAKDDSMCWMTLGSLYQDTGDLKNAVKCYEKSLELNPGNNLAADNLVSAKSTLNKNQVSSS